MLIVAQVAVAVAVLPAAVFVASRVIRMELAGAGFPVESIVAGYVGLESRRAACRSRSTGGTAAGTPGQTRGGARRDPRGVFIGHAGVWRHQRRFASQDGVRVRAGADYIPDVGITDALLPSMTRVSVDAVRHLWRGDSCRSRFRGG